MNSWWTHNTPPPMQKASACYIKALCAAHGNPYSYLARTSFVYASPEWYALNSKTHSNSTKKPSVIQRCGVYPSIEVPFGRGLHLVVGMKRQFIGSQNLIKKV